MTSSRAEQSFFMGKPLGLPMPARTTTSSGSPSNDELMAETEALMREFAQDALKWARSALRLADRMGDAAVQAGEQVVHRAERAVARQKGK